VAHWQTISRRPVRAAMLVAVPDPMAALFPVYGMAFARIPQDRLRFASLVVASTDDPYGSRDYAEARAARWGSGIAIIGSAGHINAQSGLGDWPQGRALLDGLVAEAA
ncbi:alpha/beta hydrolase, partial [Mesorhizobium sp. M2A.F.Ca.ET.067.02.1.1]